MTKLNKNPQFEKHIIEISKLKDVYIAGGIINNEINKIVYSNVESKYKSDCDIFICYDDNKTKINKVKSILDIIHKNTKIKSIKKLKNLIVCDTDHGEFDIVLRNCKSLELLLNNFDIDACCVGLKNGKIFFNKRYIYAIEYGMNLIIPSKCTYTHLSIHRMNKYLIRGYIPCIPWNKQCEKLFDIQNKYIHTLNKLHKEKAKEVEKYIVRPDDKNVEQPSSYGKAKEVVEHIVDPSAKNVVEHIVEPSAKNIVEHIVEPSAKNVVEHIVEPSAKNIVDHIVEPSAKEVVEHIVEPSSYGKAKNVETHNIQASSYGKAKQIDTINVVSLGKTLIPISNMQEIKLVFENLTDNDFEIFKSNFIDSMGDTNTFIFRSSFSNKFYDKI